MLSDSLLNRRANINESNNRKYTVLHEAASNGHTHIVRFLSSSYSNIDKKEIKNILQIAVENNVLVLFDDILRLNSQIENKENLMRCVDKFELKKFNDIESRMYLMIIRSNICDSTIDFTNKSKLIKEDLEKELNAKYNVKNDYLHREIFDIYKKLYENCSLIKLLSFIELAKDKTFKSLRSLCRDPNINSFGLQREIIIKIFTINKDEILSDYDASILLKVMKFHSKYDDFINYSSRMRFAERLSSELDKSNIKNIQR